MSQPHTPRLLLWLLLAASCSDRAATTTAGATSATGGGSGGDSSDSGSAGGDANEGGNAGAPLGSSGSAGAPEGNGGSNDETATTGTAGSAGSEEPACRPSAIAPTDTCEYPESLGGAGDPTRCAVTPGAWYPLGDSEMTIWPAPWNERAELTEQEFGAKVVFDLDNQPIVGWWPGSLDVRRWNGSDWEALPLGELARTGTAGIDLRLDNSGNLVVLEQFESSMRVLRWSGENWTALGDWSAPLGPAGLAVDAEDQPIVVYGVDGRLHVRRWNGTVFEELPGNEADGSLGDVQADAHPRVAVRHNGDIIAAWRGLLGPNTSQVQRFHAGQWEPLIEIDSPDTPNLPQDFGLAVDNSDQLVLAWSEASGRVQVWDGTAWLPQQHGLERSELLQSLDGTIYLHGKEYYEEDATWEWQDGEWVDSPDLDGGIAGSLTVGRDGTFAAHAFHYVYTWDGDYPVGYDLVSVDLYTDGRWRALPSPTAQGVGVRSARPQELVAGDAGWFLHDSKCGVARWDGEAWRTFDLSEWRTLPNCGGSTLSESPTGQLVLTMWVAEWAYPESDLDNRVLDYDFAVHVLGWNGEAWEPLIDPYDSSGLFDSPSVALDSNGSIFVAWTKLYDANFNIYSSGILAWDGAGWAELPNPRDWNPSNIQLTSLSDDRVLAVWHDDPSEYDEWTEADRASIYEAGEWHDLPDLPTSSTPLSATHDTNGTPFLVGATDTDLVLYELSASDWRRVTPDEARLATLPESIRTQVFSEDGEVYLRRFEDCGWRGLSASDRGGGVSNSAESAFFPSFATHDGTTCVTWAERFKKGSAQFVRCHD